MKKTLLFTLSTFLCGLITLAPGQTLTARAAVAIPSMELEDYPVTDGSLACMPLLTELCMKVTGCNEAAAEDAIDFSNTNPSYINMAQGTRDLLLSYEPSSETKQELEAYPALTKLPVGRDALVFIVNADNPVDSLTEEQIAEARKYVISHQTAKLAENPVSEYSYSVSLPPYNPNGVVDMERFISDAKKDSALYDSPALQKTY